MALTCQPLFFITFTILFLPCITTNAKPRKLVTKLVHRHSTLPPLNDSKNDAQSNLLSDNYIFLVNFSIGEPAVSQLAVMDTGSDLTWVQCTGCTKCMPQNGPRFDPLKSLTFHNLPCSSDECGDPSIYSCNSEYADDNCTYDLEYGDHSTTKGVIATEHLQFETPDEDTIVIRDVMFGCGLENKKTTNAQWDGVFGLGNSVESVVHKLGRRFSYCIGNILDPSYSFNRLTIGEGAIVEGYSTPYETDGSSYFVTLEGISLGEERLNIDSNVFKKTSKGGGVMLDSGATLTYLSQVAYNLVRKNVSKMFDGVLKQITNKENPKRLCFPGIASQELQGFPAMTFHLANGADLVVDAGSLFYQSDPNLFCLSVEQQIPNFPSVIGIIAQQYYNVAFDLDKRNIYFQRIDCELLDD